MNPTGTAFTGPSNLTFGQVPTGIFMYGPKITYRGQPHGTFKFLFNGIYYGHSETVNLNKK